MNLIQSISSKASSMNDVLESIRLLDNCITHAELLDFREGKWNLSNDNQIDLTGSLSASKLYVKGKITIYMKEKINKDLNDFFNNKGYWLL